jgi:hypothetical protein
MFIWCDDNVDYPRKLARYLAREDIEIVPLRHALRYMNKRMGYVICDHALELPGLQDALREHTLH